MGGDIWRPQLRAKCQKIDSKNDVVLRHSRPFCGTIDADGVCLPSSDKLCSANQKAPLSIMGAIRSGGGRPR